MDCSKVKELLIQYIDKSLRGDLSADVKKHLSTCKACAAEAASLTKYKKAMASLEHKNAPADFMLELNARIEKRRFPGIFKTLFFPLKIKLPIEAAGVFATVAVTLMLYNFSGQNEKSEYLAVNKDMNIELREEQKAKVAGSAVSNAGKIPASSVPAKEKKEIALAGKGIASRAVSGSKTYEIALLLHGAGSFEEAPVRESGEGFYPQTRIQAKQAASGPGKLYSVPPAPEREMDSLETRKAVPEKKSGDEIKDEAAIARNAPAQSVPMREATVSTVIDPVKAIRDMVTGLKGTVAVERKKKDGPAISIIADIPAVSTKEFIGKLKALGSIRPADKLPGGEGTGRVRFRINIIRE